MNIVLYEPEIPQNTGNIGRTCVASGASLHLIRPLGFDISDKAVKRAGLDYWHSLDLHVYDSYGDFREKNKDIRLFMATTKARRVYSQPEYREDDFFMFGPESRGIPEEILVTDSERCIRIPMLGEFRSLNLSNSVAIVLYEALRQQGFCGMLTAALPHRLQ